MHYYYYRCIPDDRSTQNSYDDGVLSVALDTGAAASQAVRSSGSSVFARPTTGQADGVRHPSRYRPRTGTSCPRVSFLGRLFYTARLPGKAAGKALRGAARVLSLGAKVERTPPPPPPPLPTPAAA